MSKPILTSEDLAERWQVHPQTAMRIVRTQQVPFIQLSAPRGASKNIKFDGAGKKQYRFRLVDIERWEEKNLVHIKNEKPVVVDPNAAPYEVARKLGWDGVIR